MQTYTLTFPTDQNRAYNNVLERFTPEQYSVVSGLAPAKNKYGETVSEATLQLDEDAAFMLRMGMRNLTIKQHRTAEEQAELDRIKEEKTVRVSVTVHTGENNEQ